MQGPNPGSADIVLTTLVCARDMRMHDTQERFVVSRDALMALAKLLHEHIDELYDAAEDAVPLVSWIDDRLREM